MHNRCKSMMHIYIGKHFSTKRTKIYKEILEEKNEDNQKLHQKNCTTKHIKKAGEGHKKLLHKTYEINRKIKS